MDTKGRPLMIPPESRFIDECTRLSRVKSALTIRPAMIGRMIMLRMESIMATNLTST